VIQKLLATVPEPEVPKYEDQAPPEIESLEIEQE
jgi:hypothetical protein